MSTVFINIHNILGETYKPIILGIKRTFILKNTLETSGEDVKTTLQTSGEDVKTTLETSGEDVKTTLETSVAFYRNFLSITIRLISITIGRLLALKNLKFQSIKLKTHLSLVVPVSIFFLKKTHLSLNPKKPHFLQVKKF